MSHPSDSQELRVPQNPRRLRWWWIIVMLVIAGGIMGGVAYKLHHHQTAPAAAEKVAKVEEPCDLDYLTSQEDRAQLAKLQAENKEIAATEDSSEKALVEEFALADRFASEPAGLPSFKETDVGRFRHTMEAQLQDGRCVLKSDRSDNNRPLPVTWSRVASTLAKAFGGLDLNPDVKARKKERVVNESSFVSHGWSGVLNAYTHQQVLEGVLVNEDQLHTLISWILAALPSLVEPAGMDMDELLVWLADYHKVAKAGGFASFDKARIKADEKWRKCWSECEGDGCDRCPEIFVAQDKNVVRGQVLRRWLKVRGELKEDATKDDIKAAEQQADQMLLVWRFWLAKTAEVLGDVKSAKSWASSLESAMKKAADLKHRDYYLGEIARMKALKPPPKS